MRAVLLVISIILLVCNGINAEGLDDKRTRNLFMQPEFLIGKTLPSNSNFPKTDPQHIISVSIGKFVQDPSKAWSVFYNYPSIGLSFSYTHFGHKEILGNAFTLMPFIAISATTSL